MVQGRKEDLAPPRSPRLRGWIVGLLLLAGLIAAVTHLGELEHFAKLVRQAQPPWLAVAALLQFGTYFSMAAVWRQALRHEGVDYPLIPLVPLGVAKLFFDQALPSGGMTGTAFFVVALKRRGIAAPLCMGALLVSLVAYYTAFVLVAAASMALLWFHHDIHPWIIAVAMVFLVIAVAIPGSVLLLKRWSRSELPAWLLRMPGVGDLSRALADVPGRLLNPALLLATIVLHGSIFLLDSATLWAMLAAVGQHAPYWAAFTAFILASVVALLGLVPLGLGTFEATCVVTLRVLGVQLEAALTATLLLRGFTLWLPMLPGLWLARRELS